MKGLLPLSAQRFTPLAAALLIFSQSAIAAPVRMVTGDMTQKRTMKLTSEIHWYHDLKQAESQAKREGKMIFWMHMLGQLDGTT